MVNYLVIGAGMMGGVIAEDLLQRAPDLNRVVVTDCDRERLNALAKRLDHPRLDVLQADASDIPEMVKIMRLCDVAISAVPFEFNFGLAKAAIDAGTHFCDLGGNSAVVEQQFALSDEAKAAGVKIIPDNGIAPGAVSILTRFGIDIFRSGGFGMPKSIYIHDGGLPQEPEPPLDYALVFNAKGLVNEYDGKADILRNGKVVLVDAMSEIEELHFPEPFGLLESAHGYGGMSTLVKTYAGKIENLEYKVLRFPGHWENMNVLKKLGFLSKKPFDVNGAEVSPRAFLERLLEETLPKGVKDSMVLRMIFKGDGHELQFDMIDLFDEETGHTAMQRTTAYSVSIVAQMLAGDDPAIKNTGTLCLERDVPPKKFLEEWARRGITITKTWRQPYGLRY